MTDVISFLLNDKPVQIKDLAPTTTLLEYLRDHIAQTGTKEGCAEGDCGACTVAILDRRGPDATWRSINSCLVLLPMLHGKEVYTVEGIAAKDQLHPVQQAIVRKLGSQCGYCTPGVVMTLFEACYRQDMDAPWKMDDQLCGTLCRCTGYRPIREAAEEIRGLRPDDTPLSRTKEQPQALESLDYEVPNHRFLRPTNLMELWRAVANHPEHTFIAGATDLGLSITKHYKTWPVLIGLDAVYSSEGACRTAASAPKATTEPTELPVCLRRRGAVRPTGSKRIPTAVQALEQVQFRLLALVVTVSLGAKLH